VVLAALVAVMLIPAAAAWAHVDEDYLGWRLTWVTTQQDDHEMVRVRVVVTNGSPTERYAGECRLKIWNDTDAAGHTFAVVLRPGERVEARVTVVLDGTSDTRAKLAHCHANRPPHDRAGANRSPV